MTKPDYWGGSGSPDGLTQLEKTDDAAYRILGGIWRLPTLEEAWALSRQWTWVNQKGVLGRLGTAENGNSIFFPAGGEMQGTGIYYKEDTGYFGTSTLYTEGYNNMGPDHANVLLISVRTGMGIAYQYREYGVPIRPVLEVLLNE